MENFKENKKEVLKIIYTAEFVQDKEDLLNKFPPKHLKVFAHHSTISFRPSGLEGIDIGRESSMKITARVFDEKGDALLVENSKSSFKYPHITLSCAAGVPPVYSNELIDKAILNKTVQFFEQPIEIKVTEGYFDGENDIISKKD